MQLFLIDPNRTDLYKNNLFDFKKHPSLKLFYDARNLLKKQNILLDTIDLHDIKKADQIFFFDHEPFFLLFKPRTYLNKCNLFGIPRKKLNLVIWECPVIKPENWLVKNHQYYGKVFTWNDSLIDNKKYYHYYWPQNTDKKTVNNIPFEKKKFLTLINANKTNYLPNELYSLRIKAIRYFEKYHPKDFDLYGYGWNKRLELKNAFSALKYHPTSLPLFISDYIKSFKKLATYKGVTKDKIITLSQYKFALCFENMTNIDGYITEKIFDCFKAKCIPIYLGAKNINDHIPSNTLIDFRKFKNFNKMYKYIVNIDGKTYNEYLININEFLEHEKLKKWSYKFLIKSIFFT